MKKTAVGLVATLFLAIFLAPSEAATPKALVIIDSYFDSRVSGEGISCIVLETNTKCTDIIKTFPTSLIDNLNHGNAMVVVAKKQNPELSVIGLRSAPSPTSNVTPATFIQALKWVDLNSDKVSAVSVSRFFNHTTKPCMPPASAPWTPDTADTEIKRLISVLNTKGIKVFASTGNAPKTVVDYPACIVTTMSVTNPGNVSNINTDFFADLVRTPLMGNNFVSTISGFKLIPLTTSSATAAIAAKWATTPGFPGLMVSVSS